MLLLNWFNASDAKEFANGLAGFYLERLSAIGGRRKKSGDKQFEKVMGQMQMQIAKFRREHRLNLYRRAQLGNTFKWRLLESGVASADADELTKWVLVQLS